MGPLAIAHGFLHAWPFGLDLALLLLLVLTLGYLGAPSWGWTLGVAALLWAFGWPVWLLVVLGVPALALALPWLRRPLVSARLLRLMQRLKVLPQISATERAAIEAGTVWLDGELFSGRPDWKKVLAEPYPELSATERAFLDGPCETVCRMTNDWEVWQQGDLPAAVWDYLKQERFFGMIIPREFGGLGFSASMNSAVVQKLASRSLPLAVTVMVPNSLGPAELLVHYGTEAQKSRWLPGLASGAEVPCFALTEPGAGSDAGAIQASGTVFRREDGQLCVRLRWNKRYITLAAVATVLGIAFVLRDPDNLLGLGTEPGITCALIPTNAPGVALGRRHDPLGVPFFNCPTEGNDVVVPIDAIIGGERGAGRGWQMLMNCLAAGRGISIPACAAGGAKLVARVASAHAAVRKQFGLPIGRFEGIEEPLARIAGTSWLLEAARRTTCAGLDGGAKPSVVTAIAKHSFSELYRAVINDGMDVLAGNAISRGPRNLLAHGYIGAPISITVEGANILTRTLMIFGQGAIRCHPWVLREIEALERGDVKEFDRAFFGHVRHVVRNAFRAFLLSVTRGRLARAPVGGPGARWFQKLSWASASFAVLADVAMATLAGDLKRKEKLTGRFADVLAWLYLGACALKRFEAEGRRAEDEPALRWAMETALARIQTAFDGIYHNFGTPFLGALFRGPVAWWSRSNRLGAGPSDRLGARLARAVQQVGTFRDGVTTGIHVPKERSEALGRLEHAFALCFAADEVASKIKDAVRKGALPRERPEKLLPQAIEKGIVTAAEAEQLKEAEAARWDAVQVDSFTLEEYLRRGADLQPHLVAQ
jgi:acyl-CoA dehydrogenase